MPSDFDLELYRFETERLLTPALAIYPQLVKHNIDRILALLDANANRWRPHLKTVKTSEMLKLLVQAGVTTAKCATTRELLVACQSGFQDVLVAFAHTGANAARIIQIAREYPEVRVATLIEAPDQIATWQARTGRDPAPDERDLETEPEARRGATHFARTESRADLLEHTPVSIFIDINPGMNRTGVERDRIDNIVQLARQVSTAGLDFRGLHFYDGHATEQDLQQRIAAAHKRYDDLMTIIAAIEKTGLPVREVVTTGTPALPCALTYPGFTNNSFLHQVSPGTVIYNDLSSLKQLPADYDLIPAVVVVSRVISHPKPGVITCDAGHKSLSVDSGVPNCAVIGQPGFVPLKPSEEHLPIELPEGATPPPLGSVLYLVPRHVCPTVNNANYAVLVEDGVVSSVTEVTARGHENPYSANHNAA